MQTTSLTRLIKYGERDLADFNPDAPIADVVKMHAAQHPELATASLEGPVYEEGCEVYTVNTRLGTKG